MAVRGQSYQLDEEVNLRDCVFFLPGVIQPRLVSYSDRMTILCVCMIVARAELCSDWAAEGGCPWANLDGRGPPSLHQLNWACGNFPGVPVV
jgi:hypothetical protein